jgi:alkylation response protein AidB-like acyl-CoA dehydrogenase
VGRIAADERDPQFRRGEFAGSAYRIARNPEAAGMDFDLSPEELAFQREVEAFLAANASSDVMDANPEQLSQTVDTPAKRAFMRKLAERGWLGMSWPRKYGGQEKSGIYDFLLTEALSRCGAPQPGKGVGIVGKTIIRHGNETLKQYFLPRIIRGEIEFAIGYSEPQAGSDAANMQLRAAKVAGGWKLDGRKIWTTSAHFADWYWVGARTDPGEKHKGITLFLVEMNHPGLTIHPTWTIGDERTNEVFFDDVFVGDEFVVGQVNHGWTYICEALDLERFAMMPVGPLEKKVEALTDWARAAVRDGVPVRKDPRVRRTTAQAVAQLEVARLLQRRVISEALKDRVPTVQSSQYKLFMNELGQRVANAALDLIGAEAQLKPGSPDAPIGGRFERSYRYTVVDTIGGGTSEIQKNIIARRGLGLPPSY